LMRVTTSRHRQYDADDEEVVSMKISLATSVIALLWISLMPVDAQTIYATQRCRVYYDTAYIKIPGQCGTVMPFYPRKLFARASRQPVYYDYPYCCRLD